MNYIFKNITCVTMQPENPVIYNADVGIQGRKIAFVRQAQDENASAPPALSAGTRIIDGTHRVLMPGLYNSHAHAGMTLFRGYANDRTLEDWLFNYIFPAERKLTPELVYTGTTLAIAEMIASGTIAFSDMYFFMDEVARAALDAGVLANVSNGVIGFDRDAYDFHKDNVYEQSLRTLEEYHGAHSDGRILAEASIHGAYTSHPPAWTQVMEFAAKHELGLHIHLSETAVENQTVQKAFNASPTRVFYDHGVLDRAATAAHGVHLSDEDITLLAEKNVTICHNPVSNLKLASGLAPISKLLKAGINVTLGTDGMASNNSHDLFEEIKLASILQKYSTGDPTALPAYEVLRLATANGARAQGRAQESGIIAEGFDADLVVLDFDTPRQTICHEPMSALAYSTTGRDVLMTMCRGKMLYENGEYLTIDIEKTLSEARAARSVFADGK